MFDASAEASTAFARNKGISPDSVGVVVADLVVDAKAIARHFRENYPVLLDGALTRQSGRRHLVRQARETLARGRVDPETLPAEILRETLDAVALPETRETPAKTNSRQAGFVAIGPNQARIWWDHSVLDNLEDVLTCLDKPRSALRFYDVTGLDPESGRWHETFDIEVNVSDSGHTAQCMRSDRVYVVDLGYIHADGRFLRLARTNTVAFPRDGKGAPATGETARCLLRPRNRQEEAGLVPDAAAREWVADRPDSPDRDIEAELAVHMLYRAFLKEGVRALRRAARTLARRDAAILEREYAERRRDRERRADTRGKQHPEIVTAFLVARLDAENAAMPSSRAEAENAVKLLPAVLRATEREWTASAGSAHFARFATLLALARTHGYSGFASAMDAAPVDAEIEPIRRVRLVQVVPADYAAQLDPELTAALSSAPVFAAAKTLRDRIKNIPASPKPQNAAADHVFGGLEAKRLAKAGVRITRMALTLEGRMRPGARLKVAGRLVRADADGRFRLECVLSGKKASIPMRAGVSAGGEARSLINVEWEKRVASER